MLVPAIHFPGGVCTDAIRHYQTVFGAEVIHISYDKDAPSDSGMMVTEETKNHVMHAEMIICGTRVNMCDVKEKVEPGNSFLFNVFFDTVDEVGAAFNKIISGGKILTELGPQFWTPMYGEVIDRFGVHWQLMAKQNS